MPRLRLLKRHPPITAAASPATLLSGSKPKPPDDAAIRTRLLDYLKAIHASTPNTMVMEELGLEYGHVRADVAVIGSVLHAYEIKSDRDTFVRLPAQMAVYNAVSNLVTLVTGPKHEASALKRIPSWWGLTVARPSNPADPASAIRLQPIRRATQNPEPDKAAIARILWRPEALQELTTRGLARGYRSATRKRMCAHLAENMELEEVRSMVYRHIRTRGNWRGRFRAQRAT